MNFRIIIYIFLPFFIFSCEPIKQKKVLDIDFSNRYKNHGFTLIFNNDLNTKKKLDSRSLMIFHKSLKKKSFVKITNPENGKSLIAEVKSNRVKFSNFYNSVITTRIAEDLDLNLENPYIELLSISKDSTFIAKKTKTFEEEKKVAEKAPIDGIQINDLNKKKSKKNKIKDKKFSYSIKIADFYYKDSAKLMIERIKNETSIQNAKIIKLTETKYRVLLGPFNDIKTIEQIFEKIESLNFENVEVLKNV